jgi:mono/diheme cytochrome c family protein
MQNLPKPIRLFAPLVALLAAVLVIAGCGTSSPDIARGRVLFTTKCGVCHTLAQAGTTATVGPNLDDAFAAAREVGGFDDATVEGIVKNQIDNPRPSIGNPASYMPAHIAEGTDADDIAAYVGKYAGVPGAAPPEVEGGAGAQVFANFFLASQKRKSKNRSSTRKPKSPKATRPVSCRRPSKKRFSRKNSKNSSNS